MPMAEHDPTLPDPDGSGAGADTRGGLPRWLRAILLLVLIAVGVVVLFLWVFPWVEERMQDPTMGAVTTWWATRS
jgi:hypothetical protein